MLLASALWLIVAACVAWVVTWRVRRFALAHGILDVPNARSSHVQPTPRGGGLGIVVAIEAALCLLWLRSPDDMQPVAILGLCAALVALVGYIDDKRGVPAVYRFGVHAFAAALAIWSLLPVSQAVFAGVPGWVAFLVLVLGVVWSTNLFNFMDGIDGIAASEAVFASSSTAVFISLQGGPQAWATIAFIAAGASLGFLVWNWAPAKVFMGDVGSGFLGFWLSAFGICLAVEGVLSIWTSIILASAFIADATTTLVVRLVRGERVYEAHRSHAYQHLARKLKSHAKVSLLVWLVNIGIALPAAYLSMVQEQIAPWLGLGVVALLSAVCLKQGAGVRSP